MRRLGFVFLAVLTLLGESKLLFQKPTLNATQIAFVYAGDLWLVGRDATAQRPELEWKLARTSLPMRPRSPSPTSTMANGYRIAHAARAGRDDARAGR